MVNVEHPHMREFGLYKGLLKRLRTTINEPAGTQKSGEGNLVWVRVPPPAQQKTATSTQKGAEVILSAPYFCLLRLVLYGRPGFTPSPLRSEARKRPRRGLQRASRLVLRDQPQTTRGRCRQCSGGVPHPRCPGQGSLGGYRPKRCPRRRRCRPHRMQL